MLPAAAAAAAASAAGGGAGEVAGGDGDRQDHQPSVKHAPTSYVRLSKKRKNHYPAWYTKRSKMLSKKQKTALKELWPKIGRSEQAKTLKYGVEVDLDHWFGKPVAWGGAQEASEATRPSDGKQPRQRWIDIGFGTGTSLLDLASSNPCDDFLGVEIFRAGNA